MFVFLALFVVWAHSVFGVDYSTVFHLDSFGASLQKQIEEISYLQSLHDRTPDTMEDLRWRADRDKIHIERFLCSKGYMNAKVRYDIKDAALEKEIATVDVYIQGFDAFHYKKISMRSDDAPSWFKESMIRTASVRKGAQVDYDNIQRALERLEKRAKNKGYPWALCDKPVLDIPEDGTNVDLIFPITFGPYAKIGTTKIEGLTHVDSSYVRNHLAWKEGQRFDQRLIERTKETLVGTMLFSDVDIQVEKRPDDESIVDIRVKLTEAAARTLGVGLRYATSEGIGGRVFWRHRNVWGKAHAVELGSRRTKLQTRTEAKWDVPDFWQPQQTLSNAAFNSIERQRAYRGRIYGASVMVGRSFKQRLNGKVGGLVDCSRLRQDGSHYRARLVGVPVHLYLDGTNSLLDPTKGVRFAGWGTPFWGTLNHKKSRFINTRFHVSGYLPLGAKNRGSDRVVVVAGFVRLGKILGDGVDNVPPHQRFYSGGADSIRAYGPQMLGPLDKNNVPLGGYFLTEYGGELRFRTTETLGFVLFAEAGNLTTHSVKDTWDHFMAKSLWGVGTGVRYYTPLGPLRVDVAFPINRRRDANKRAIDSPYQFYISFGQAF